MKNTFFFLETCEAELPLLSPQNLGPLDLCLIGVPILEFPSFKNTKGFAECFVFVLFLVKI